MIKSRSAKQIGLLYGSRIVVILFGTGITMINTRVLGPASYGVLAFTLSVLSLTAMFFEFGFFSAGARILAVTKEYRERRAFIGGLFLIALCIGLIYSLSVLGISFFIDPIFKTSIAGILRLIAPLAFFLPIEYLMVLICQGTNQIKYLSIYVAGPSVLYFFLLLANLIFRNNSVTLILFLNISSIAALTIWLAIQLKPLFSDVKQKIKRIIKETKEYGRHVYFGRVIGVSTYNLDNIFISLFVNTTFVGFYSIAVLLTTPVLLLSRALGTTKFRDFSREKTIPFRILASNFLWAFLGSLLVLLFGRYVILILFSSNFLTAADYLLPLSFSVFFQSLYQPYTSFFGAKGKGKWLRNIALTQAIVNISFNVLLIKLYGAMGASVASLISNSFVYVIYLKYYRRYLNKPFGYQEKESEYSKTLVITGDLLNSEIRFKEMNNIYADIDKILSDPMTLFSSLEQISYQKIILDCEGTDSKIRKRMLLASLFITAKNILYYQNQEWKKVKRTEQLKILGEFAGKILIASFILAYTHIHSFIKAYSITKDTPKTVKGRNASEISIAFLRSTIGPPLKAGGSHSHITGFVKAAKKRIRHIEIYSAGEITETGDVPVNIIRPPAYFELLPELTEIYYHHYFYRRLKKILSHNKPDLLYQRHERFNFTGVLLAKKLGIPLFLEFNSSEVWKGKHWGTMIFKKLGLLMEKAALRGATLIFVVSQNMKDQLIANGVPAPKIVVNPNGTDPKEFSPDINGREIRDKLSINNKILYGFVGTFGVWHGVNILTDAIIKIAPGHPNLHFLIIGKGKSMREEINKIKKSGCEDSVTFTELIPHQDIPKYLAACDVLVSPHVPLADNTPFFGSPTKLFEYMAMGKPIVASSLAQIGQVLEDEKSALLVEPGNVDQLAEAIIRISDDKSLREKIGKGAREKLINNYTWQHNADRILNMIQFNEKNHKIH
ncbi:MAG: glycosyltransferase [Patescibacteria group bacterium]